MTFKTLLEGMIEKNYNKLDQALSKDAVLIHMNGRRENKEEYIKDILNNNLNYYDYEILEFDIDYGLIKLLAAVYGGRKNWWKLRMHNIYVLEDEKVKIKESIVKLG